MNTNIEYKYSKGCCVKLTRRPELGTFTIYSVKAFLDEDNSRVSYDLIQDLWKGAFGLSECFTLRGIAEKELELAEKCEEIQEEVLDQLNTEL